MQKILLKTMFCFDKVQRALRIQVFCQFVYYNFRINLLVTSLGCLNVFGCRKTRRPFFNSKIAGIFLLFDRKFANFFPNREKIIFVKIVGNCHREKDRVWLYTLILRHKNVDSTQLFSKWSFFECCFLGHGCLFEGLKRHPWPFLLYLIVL
jgi:hypothetical protein